MPNIPGLHRSNQLSASLDAGIESVCLLLVVASPWAFGAVHPLSLFVLYCGVATCLLLFATKTLVERSSISRCYVTIALTALVAIGAIQAVPLGHDVVRSLTPATAELRSFLVPDDTSDVRYKPAGTLSLEPFATQTETLKLLAVLSMFVVVRHGFATPESFRRLAIACVINGSALSVFAIAQKSSSEANVVYWSMPSLGSVYGPFICRNHFPYYVNVCIGMGLGLLLNQRRRTPGATDQATPWIVFAMGMMVAANLYSLSRGGTISLLMAGMVSAAILFSTKRSRSMASFLIGATIAIGVAVWVGSRTIANRLGTIGDGALDEGRSDLWDKCLALFSRFPVIGTGYGTFPWIEATAHAPGGSCRLSWDHAHNDYLELLIEGGPLPLLIIVSAIVFAIRRGIGGWTADSPSAGLILGGVFGLAAIAVHSTADFGMHMPAIALLATVVLGHLIRTTSAEPSANHGWVKSIAIVAVCLVSAGLLVREGWSAQQAEAYRLASLKARFRDKVQTVRYLQTACHVRPEDASLRLSLAAAQYEYFLEGPGRESFLASSMENHLLARKGRPTAALPHVRLAANRAYVERPLSSTEYLRRACATDPADGGHWYLAGLAAVDEKKFDVAWDCWKNSLRCNGEHVPDILPTAIAQPNASEVLDQLLPDSATTILDMAMHPSIQEHESLRRRLIQRALSLSEAKAHTLDEEASRGKLLLEIGDSDAAVVVLDRVVQKSPSNHGWRLCLAKALQQSKRSKEAIEHLRIILRDSPHEEAARVLHTELTRPPL